MKALCSTYGVVSFSRPFLFVGLLFALRLHGNLKEFPVTANPADGSSNDLFN